MVMARLFSTLSVRGRIIVLGVIPLFGFLATGLAFVSGDSEVGHAYACAAIPKSPTPAAISKPAS
jgi:hypothetical protein